MYRSNQERLGLFNRRVLLGSLLILGSAGVAGQPGQDASQGSESFEEIEVYGENLTKETSTGSRLGLTLMETPATVEIISGDDIRARNDLTGIEAVTRTGGFTNAAAPGNGGSSIAARGFTGQGVVTKLFDGTHY